jgi:hypothetical protein
VNINLDWAKLNKTKIIEGVNGFFKKLASMWLRPCEGSMLKIISFYRDPYFTNEWE